MSRALKWLLAGLDGRSLEHVARTTVAATVSLVAARALLATYFGASAIVFAAGLLVMGLLCALPHVDRSAYRFAGITLAIVMPIARTLPPWVIAVHRFVEVAAGIIFALIVVAMWPERESLPRPGERALSGTS